MFDANFTNRIQIHGNGKQKRAFIHVNVLVNALIGCPFNHVPSGTFNAVDKNLEILDIVDVLKEIYPSLEFIFINQHLELWQIQVDRNSKLREFVEFENQASLKEELRAFFFLIGQPLACQEPEPCCAAVKSPQFANPEQVFDL